MATLTQYLQQKEIKVFDENIPGFFSMDFTGKQTVQGPADSFSANCKHFSTEERKT